MIWEYVVVEFRDQRDVFVGGSCIGRTNVQLRVERGEHTFDLGTPVDYDPPYQRRAIEGTSTIRPAMVRFDVA